MKDYNEMVAWQDGKCAICQRPDDILHVDHDHRLADNGEAVRGLLCIKCNMALGLLADSPPRIRAAAAYLDGDA